MDTATAARHLSIVRQQRASVAAELKTQHHARRAASLRRRLAELTVEETRLEGEVGR